MLKTTLLKVRFILMLYVNVKDYIVQHALNKIVFVNLKHDGEGFHRFLFSTLKCQLKPQGAKVLISLVISFLHLGK